MEIKNQNQTEEPKIPQEEGNIPEETAIPEEENPEKEIPEEVV